MPDLLDGRVAAKKIREELSSEIMSMARPPHLVTVLVGDDPASVTYVRLKHKDSAEIGLLSTPYELPATTPQAELLDLVDRLNADPEVDGFIVQSPLPAGLDWDEVMERTDPAKDVDGTHPVNLGRLMMGAPRFVSATPAGVLELLRHYDIDLSGKLVGVAGRGPTVGRPLSVLLSLKGTDATVLTCHSRTHDLPGELRRCDVVVAAMGQPHMITGDYIKPGAVVVDVGQGKGPDGKLLGDIDRPTVDPVAGWVSPTPGGVGPMTRVMLLSNTVAAARSRLAR